MAEKIVFLHGFGITTLADEFLALFRSNYDVYTPILPGHREGKTLSEGYAMSNYSHWLNDYLTGNEIDECHLVGFSLGGLIALKYTQHFPTKVKSLTLLAVPINPKRSLLLKIIKPLVLLSLSTPQLAQFTKTAISQERLLAALVRFFPSAGRGIEVLGYQRVLNDLTLMEAETMRDILFSLYATNLEKSLLEINKPVLLLVGGQDQILTTKEAQRLTTLSTKIQLAIVANAPHLLTITNPAETAQAIKIFIINTTN